MKKAWLLGVLLFAGCAAFQSLFLPDRPSFVPPEAVRVSGAHARAIAVAYDDWMAHMEREKAVALAPDDDVDGGDGGGVVMPDEVRIPLIECLGRPEAYETWVHQNDAGTIYEVDVLPFDEACFGKNDKWLHAGGGAIYEIDARTFEILKKEIQE